MRNQSDETTTFDRPKLLSDIVKRDKLKRKKMKRIDRKNRNNKGITNSSQPPNIQRQFHRVFDWAFSLKRARLSWGEAVLWPYQLDLQAVIVIGWISLPLPCYCSAKTAHGWRFTLVVRWLCPCREAAREWATAITTNITRCRIVEQDLTTFIESSPIPFIHHSYNSWITPTPSSTTTFTNHPRIP